MSPVHELEDRYVLEKVPYRNEKYTVEWSKALMNTGKEHTQDEWQDVLKDSEWNLPSSELYFSTLRSLYLCQKNKQSELVEDIRKMFEKDLQKLNMTSTRVFFPRSYPDDGIVKIMHDYAMPSESVCDASLAHAKGFIAPYRGYGYCGTPEELETSAWSVDSEDIAQASKDKVSAVAGLFGTKNLQDFERVLYWGTKQHAFMREYTPNEGVGAVVLGYWGWMTKNTLDIITAPVTTWQLPVRGAKAILEVQK